jgi:hypothetical protein
MTAGVPSERSLPAQRSQFEWKGVPGVKLVDGALLLEDDLHVRDDPAWVEERPEAWRGTPLPHLPDRA